MTAETNGTEFRQATLPEADDGLLRGFWYPAAISARIRGRQLIAAELLGIPLVLGRDAAGRAFALEDFCPHRGMPLSCGRFDGRRVECCYHGWQFDPHSGQCLEVPSRTERDRLRVDRIFTRRFAAAERDGYLWVYVPEAAAAGPDPPAEQAQPPELPKFSDRFTIVHLEAGMPCHVDHGIIGLMDPAHGPFVHQSWWWRKRKSIYEKEKVFEPIPHGFRIVPHQPSANSGPYKLLKLYGHPVTTTIEFVLPNMRFEQIRCGPYWFSSRATVTPVRRDYSRIDFVAAWNVFRWVPGMVPIFRAFARRFIEQDRRTMEMQAEGLRRNPKLMLIDDADRPAKWYFQLKARLMEMRRTGADIPHPIPGPVALRWRS